MIKLVYVLQRRPDVEPADFHEYWLKSHAPKVRERAEALRARRYVQSHLVETPANEALREARGMLEAAPGVTSVWWNRLEDFETAQQDPAAREASAELAADEATFIDIARSQVFLTEEHPIFDFTGGRKLGPEVLKCTYLLARRSGMSADDCHRTWLADHGPLVASFARANGMWRYTQSHTIAPAVDAAIAEAREFAEPLDGLTEVWVGGATAGSDPETAARSGPALIEDERRFVEMGRSRCFFTSEHEIFDLG